ncbi:hypothetical protein RGQ13_04215 [Thalassotalea psychrophila]|uniref:DUF1579 domain-containing protein n=1 Tax=Thalassotalea psychrophila TaxID=3065647 RepID=A0ABY9TWJ6_9GAMM|nr:hypothetical protein RGQ13_04215 [Colwelliaceae bacterium SQ149]
MFNRTQLIGNWHRSEKNDEESFSEFAQLFADGTFVFTFYTYNIDGTLLEEVSEQGDWGLVGDIHFTITKAEILNKQQYPANMEDEDNYQVYQINQINDDSFTYQHILTGESFTLSRVQESTN